MQVQVQVQVQTAKEMKVQGEVTVSTKPQATEMTARGKEQWPQRGQVTRYHSPVHRGPWEFACYLIRIDLTFGVS